MEQFRIIQATVIGIIDDSELINHKISALVSSEFVTTSSSFAWGLDELGCSSTSTLTVLFSDAFD